MIGALMPALTRYARIAYRWRIQGSPRLDYVPEDISIEVTNTCNFSCQFCPQSSPTHFERVKRTTLSPEQAETLLQKLRRGGVTTRVLHWTLDGEPFVNRKFHEICARAQAFGFDRQVFSTNGSLARHDRVRELPHRSGCRYTLCIDFAGDSAYFEQVRGTEGSWQTVLDNVRSILSDPTLEHVHVKVTDISSYGFSEPGELERRRRELVSLFEPSRRLVIVGRVFHNMAGFVQLGKRPGKTYRVCPYPWMSLVIASNGDVVACCRDLEHKTVLGNLFEQELGEIWNGAPYQELRRRLVDKQVDQVEACRGCDLPYDGAKFGVKNLLRAAIHRLRVFDS
jgi:radical SAM protein with 4Fe4S-binding SPASM domain